MTSEAPNLADMMSLGGDFFPKHPNLTFRPITEIVGKEIVVREICDFESDKGPGVAIRCTIDGEECRLVTHSEAIRKILVSEDFAAILAQHGSVRTKIVSRHSQKTGRDYYCLA